MNISRGVGVADCLWQSLCDLTESGDESRPLLYISVDVIERDSGVHRNINAVGYDRCNIVRDVVHVLWCND